MGIYDREYLRRQPPSRMPTIGTGWRAVGMWSANTWIIVICIVVFVADVFFGGQRYFYEAGPPRLFERIQGAPSTAVVGDDETVRAVTIPVRDDSGQVYTQQVLAKPIFDQPGGQQIGWQEVLRMRFLEQYLHFSSYEMIFHLGFWRLIGFQFLHFNFMHILFNMIGLYFFGPMVERYLGSKRYLAFYLLCGICGALLYGVLNMGGVIAQMGFGGNIRIPGLLFNDMTTPLMGASAGVFGVLMAGAFLAPRAMVLLFFFLPMQLKTLAYALVAIAALTLLFGGHNAGGEAGHLGGAIAGFYFIRHPRHLHGFFDFLGRVDPTSHHYRTKGAAARARAAAKGAGAAFAGRGPSRREVDRILDKINSQGIHSLTDKEKRILREASNHSG